MYGVLMISSVNNDFQINRYTIIFDTVKGYARLFFILNITYLPYAIIKALSF